MTPKPAGTLAEMKIDFGKTAQDYGRYRAGFPDAFFDRLTIRGIVKPGLRALDLGTGTGTLARGLRLRGCEVTGLDRSAAMLEEASRLDRAAGVKIRYVAARAEATGLSDRSFDLVTAGQCWHWFDRPKAAAEACRLLVRGGRIVIAHFDWLPMPGNVVEATEQLILRHNPDWGLSGGNGMYPAWMRDMAEGGFKELESFSFDLNVPYSHEAWRGRIRASAGVAAALAPDRVARFDADLRAMLEERFAPSPIEVPHRIFAAIGRKR